MGSRLKPNPQRTFQWFFEAACPVARDKDPSLLFQYPEDFDDKDSSGTLPRFCFPYDLQRVRDRVVVQHFTFVLTDLEGCQRFGFCRLPSTCNSCLCILSYLPWFEVFYKLLNNLADYLIKGQTNEMKELLATLYNQALPLAAGPVTLQMGEQLLVSTEWPDGDSGGQKGVPYFIAPDPRSLPSIPESRNLTELIVAVDVRNLLQLFASMLFERRILIFASKLSTLTACIHALNGVLYPMYWQHIFIPVLPPHLLDYCCAPMPYLIGVHSSLAETVRARGLEEAVILNVDTNTLETPFDDLKRIPSDVMSGLKVHLKHHAASPGFGVAGAFLRAQARLFGGYKSAFQQNKEGEVWFFEELFTDHRSPCMRQFLQSAVHLQFFKQFIDSRLELLNKGIEPDDLFEEEMKHCDETVTGKKKSYQELVGNLKKGGGALIINMRSKANITAKGFTKPRFKNLLLKEPDEEYSLQRGGSVSHRRAQSDFLQRRLPITHHFGMPRPRRPAQKYRAPRNVEKVEDTQGNWKGLTAEPDSKLDGDEQEGEVSPLSDPEEMDLLGEIFDTLSSRNSHERGLLYGTRSLDLFGPDSHDYIMKDRLTTPSQESLLLSISGTEILQSWNLEEGLQTADEESQFTKESDWILPELYKLSEKEMEIRGPKETEELEWNSSKVEKMNSLTTKYERLKLEEQDAEKYVEENVAENPKEQVNGQEHNVRETVEKREEGDLGNNRQVETDQGVMDVIVVGQMRKQIGEPVEVQTNLLRQDMFKEVQNTNEGKKIIAPLPENQRPGTNSGPKSVKYQLQDKTSPEISSSAGSENNALGPDFKAAMGQGKDGDDRGGVAKGNTERAISPPIVQATVAEIQSPAYSKNNQTQTTPWGSFNSKQTSFKDNQTETTEEELAVVKVSELKKRFETSLTGN